MIERLTGTSVADVGRIGGKGSGLVRLLEAELVVPEAWVIPAPVSLDHDLRRKCLDVELVAWWAEAVAAFPGSLWAVRSSAVAEDLQDASFAGVYQTVLAVDTLESMIQAVKECWSALEETRATAYLDARGIGTEAGIALILQRMVRPDIAGVMLTENPLRPFADEIVIDAAYGLGEAVVSGRTDPDNVVLARDTGELLRERIGAKEVETRWENGLHESRVDEERRRVRCLTAADLDRLHRLASTVGQRIGDRRDLEWAVEGDTLYVLQDRPITGLPSRNPDVVWTRRFGDEYLAEYASPLGRDTMLPWLTDVYLKEMCLLSGRADLIPMEKLRSYNGYAYLNGQYAVELARAIPPSSREGQLTAWFSPLWVDKIMAVPFSPLGLARMLRAPYKDKGRGSLKDNPAALAEHCAAIDRAVAPKLQQDYSALSAAEWQRQYDEVDGFGQDHFRIIRWGMGQHSAMLHALLEKLLAKWAGDSGELYQAVVSGLPHTRTAEINRDIWELGQLARQSPQLLSVMRGPDDHATVRAATQRAKGFWRQFDDFLRRHGHRAATREVSALRWHSEPAAVFALVQAQVRTADAGTSPVEFEEQATLRRRAAEDQALAAAGKGVGGRLRRRVLTWLMTTTQAYTVYRENQRYHLDYLLAHLRLLLVEQGRRLAGRGALPEAEDVFLLSGDTFFGLVRGELDPNDPAVAREVEAARAHRDVHANRMPATFLFDDVPTEGDVEIAGAELGEGVLGGFGASAGQACGPTRVVRVISDLSAVEQGDVLVASNIDPGWTSVFPLIAGLVTETGGMLSHGAILAREYGIPTVTGCVDAVALLPDGTPVEVNGTLGTVTVLEAAS